MDGNFDFEEIPHQKKTIPPAAPGTPWRETAAKVAWKVGEIAFWVAVGSLVVSAVVAFFGALACLPLLLIYIPYIASGRVAELFPEVMAGTASFWTNTSFGVCGLVLVAMLLTSAFIVLRTALEFPIKRAIKPSLAAAPAIGESAAWTFVKNTCVARGCGPATLEMITETTTTKTEAAKSAASKPFYDGIFEGLAAVAVAAYCLPDGITALHAPLTIAALPSLVLGYYGAIGIVSWLISFLSYLVSTNIVPEAYERRRKLAAAEPEMVARKAALVEATETLVTRLSEAVALEHSAIKNVIADITAELQRPGCPCELSVALPRMPSLQPSDDTEPSPYDAMHGLVFVEAPNAEESAISEWDTKELNDVISAAIDDRRTYAAGVHVEMNEITAPDWLLPAIAVAALARLPSHAAYLGDDERMITLRLDHTALLGYRVVDVHYTAASFLKESIGIMVARSTRATGEDDDEEVFLDSFIKAFDRWLKRNSLDRDAIQDLDVRLTLDMALRD